MERPDLRGVTMVATVPPQHSYGFESTVLLALLGGASFDAGRPFYPADIAQALQAVPRAARPGHHALPPEDAAAGRRALPPVDLVLSATAPLSPQLAADGRSAAAGPAGGDLRLHRSRPGGRAPHHRRRGGTTLGELRICGASARPDGEERFLVAGGHVTEPTPLADILVLQDERHFRCWAAPTT
jgi:hypothetical protein